MDYHTAVSRDLMLIEVVAGVGTHMTRFGDLGSTQCGTGRGLMTPSVHVACPLHYGSI